jgi:hypothetical protein
VKKKLFSVGLPFEIKRKNYQNLEKAIEAKSVLRVRK